MFPWALETGLAGRYLSTAAFERKGASPARWSAFRGSAPGCAAHLSSQPPKTYRFSRTCRPAPHLESHATTALQSEADFAPPGPRTALAIEYQVHHPEPRGDPRNPDHSGPLHRGSWPHLGRDQLPDRCGGSLHPYGWNQELARIPRASMASDGACPGRGSWCWKRNESTPSEARTSTGGPLGSRR
jgi:hypothetical protein